MGNLDGKVAIVTGTSRGVGVGIARRLLEEGATVVGCSRRPLPALPAAAGIDDAGARSAQWVCDQSDLHQIDAFVRRVADTYGRIDILVNNAGGTIPTPLPEDVPPLIAKFQGSPAAADAFTFEQVKDALAAVGLPRLESRLDEEAHWNRMLSLGEQQRLGLARALLHAPQYLFLDEATASLDEPSEARLYRLIEEKLPDTTVVSIGHRSTLQAFHQRHVVLVQEGDRFTLRDSGDVAGPAPETRAGAKAKAGDATRPRRKKTD